MGLGRSYGIGGGEQACHVARMSRERGGGRSRSWDGVRGAGKRSREW